MYAVRSVNYHIKSFVESQSRYGKHIQLSVWKFHIPAELAYTPKANIFGYSKSFRGDEEKRSVNDLEVSYIMRFPHSSLLVAPQSYTRSMMNVQATVTPHRSGNHVGPISSP
eukprot:g14206.t1